MSRAYHSVRALVHQAPRSSSRSFPLLLTAADRPVEILGRNSNYTSFDIRITSHKIVHFFPTFQDSESAGCSV